MVESPVERFGPFEVERPEPGVELLVWRTPRFKTRVVRVGLTEPLDERATDRALLIGLLKRGCRRWPDMQSLARRLEELYGSAMSLDLGRLGERQLTHLRLDVVDGRFVPGGAGLLGDALEVAACVLREPLESGGGFPEAILLQERENLVHAIEALLDDKAAYAKRRLTEAMFRGEPYARFEWGEREEVARAGARELLEFHRGRLAAAAVEVYAAGHFDPAELEALRGFARGFGARPGPGADPAAVVVRPSGGPREVIEELPLTQSKLFIGYRFDPREIGAGDVPALALYNAILGGGTSTSRLFKEVREARSLAYSASSSVDRVKGFLLLGAGVSASRAAEAARVMREQVEALRRGDFSAAELETARRWLVARLQGVGDSPAAVIEFAAASRATGRDPSAEVYARTLAEVSAGDVVRVAEAPREDLTYLLRGTREDEA